MAKYYNSKVKVGRLAGSVFAIRAGETIERAYQPNVFNPSTPGQVASRARLKLVSQLSAVFANVIVFRKQGLKSERNIFTSKNYAATSFADGQSTVDVRSIQLTDGVVDIARPYLASSENNLVANLTSDMSGVIDSVVYVLAHVDSNNKVSLVKTVIGNNPGADGLFSTSLNYSAEVATGYVLFAYGVKAVTESGRYAYSNLEVNAATAAAKVVASNLVVNGDVIVTRTRAFMPGVA